MSSNVWNISVADGAIQIPIIGMGTYKSKGDEIKDAILVAIELGYRHFDTADYYENLESIGKAIKEAIETKKISRKEVFITTKVWPTWYGEGRVQASVEQMIRQSGLDFFDLVLLHWPVVLANSDTERIPIDPDTGKAALGSRKLTEIYQELECVHQTGLCRAIGLSNFNSVQVEEILKVAKIMPVTNQVECHLYFAQFKLQKFCAKHNIVLTAYCPLGTAGTRPNSPNMLADETLKTIADKYGKSPAQIALRWLIQRGIVAIPKSVHRERLQANLSLFDFEITDDDCQMLNKLHRPNGRLVLFDFNGTKQSPNYPFDLEF